MTEVQTTADAAVEALKGKRVLALVMHALVGDLEGIELVGDNADAVLIGGADDSPETNLVFSYMNLARAFGELELGADCTASTATAGGRRSAGRCSTPAATSRGSSTRRRRRRPCSASRAPPTSMPPATRSTPSRR